MKKSSFFSISFGQAEYNLSMNKRWTEQKYVIYFLLSVMVLGVCGGVSYGASCCQNEGLRGEGAELAWAADESDERYIAYTASEQRVIAVEMIAYDEDFDTSAQMQARNEETGQTGESANANTDDNAEEAGRTADGADTPSQADIGTPADTDAATNTGTPADPDSVMNTGTSADTDAAINAGTAADADADGDGSAEAAGQNGQDTETAPQTEDGADVQTGGRVIAVSDADYEALLRIVQAEAGNEDTKGKILVANVVLNRVADARFPNSAYEVIFQRSGGKAQFSPIASGSYYKVVVSDDTIEAVERALAGEDYSEGALFFAARRYAGSSQMRWFDECLTKLFSYGGHEFFTS